MRYIGIDVSKATFVVAYSSDKGGEIRTFNNTTTGIKPVSYTHLGNDFRVAAEVKKMLGK